MSNKITADFQLCVRITKPMYKELRNCSLSLGTTVPAVVRQAFYNYLEHFHATERQKEADKLAEKMKRKNRLGKKLGMTTLKPMLQKQSEASSKAKRNDSLYEEMALYILEATTSKEKALRAETAVAQIREAHPLTAGGKDDILKKLELAVLQMGSKKVNRTYDHKVGKMLPDGLPTFGDVDDDDEDDAE